MRGFKVVQLSRTLLDEQKIGMHAPAGNEGALVRQNNFPERRENLGEELSNQVN